MAFPRQYVWRRPTSVDGDPTARAGLLDLPPAGSRTVISEPKIGAEMATETTLNIAGMDRSHCASRLGQALERAEGVIKAEVDPGGTATVRYDEDRITDDDLGERVRAAGFDVA